MAEAGMFAFPVILGTMVVVAKVGGRTRWGSLEWLRLSALSILLGIVVAIHVKLVLLGLAQQVVPLVAVIASLMSTSAMVGLYVWERWQVRKKLRAITPLWVPP